MGTLAPEDPGEFKIRSRDGFLCFLRDQKFFE